jgi:hypothetical protein
MWTDTTRILRARRGLVTIFGRAHAGLIFAETGIWQDA